MGTIRAQTSCTLSTIIDVAAVYTYYYLASSTITTDEAPKDNVNQPGASTITVVSGGQNYIWQLTEPTLNIVDDVIQTAVGQLYVIECTLFSNETYDWGPLMTSSTYAAAKAAYNLSSQALSQAQAANSATSLLGGHFIYNSSWQTTNTPHSANVVQTIDVNGVDKTQVPGEWGYNVHIGANGIRLRNNEIILSEWKSNGLNFYKPITNNTQGNLTMSLTSSALSFYGSSTSTADATLDSNGLTLVKGGITGGTYNSSSTNFIYLSTDDYSGSSTITINGNSSGWRQIIGSKFGVKNDGSLYASNVDVSGAIKATSLATGTKTSSTSGKGFYVDNNGNIYVGNGSSNKFTVSNTGVVTATDVDLTGTITATSGEIGGCSISNGVLQVDAANITTGTFITARIPDLAISKITNLSSKLTTAANTANSYLAYDSTNGLRIARSSPSSATTNMVQIKSNDIRVYGSNANGYSKITSSGLTVYANIDSTSTSVANFGATTRIGPAAANKNNIVIEDDTIKFRKNATNLATFYTISNSYVNDGLTIRANGAFNVYVANRNPSSTYPDFSIYNGTSENRGFLVRFGGYFTSNPMIIASSTSSNMTLSAGTATTIPLNNTRKEIHGADLFEIQNNRVYMRELDGNPVRVTASAYVTPSSNALVNLFIYYHNTTNNIDDEVAASATYLTTNGGAVQITPRVYKVPVFSGDYFFLQARIVGSGGTVVCNHRDTQLTVELM